MTLRMCVLGSGSAGNCTVVQLPGGALMIDAGLGPRTVASRLANPGASIRDISAILLTHLDHDHFKYSWLTTIVKQGIRVHVHQRHVHALYRDQEARIRALRRAGLIVEFGDQPFPLRIRGQEVGVVCPVRGPHDRDGVVSYRLTTPSGRLAFATDLGRADHDELINAMTDVDFLAIESNYDPPMQLASSRPVYLKQRIMGGRGHLSNEQALEAICRALDRSRRPPEHIVLLHLSRQCNCPNLVRHMFSAHPVVGPRLRITSQSEPTPWLDAADMRHEPVLGQQLMMFA
jgi:L-ascorbate metabolism protein UlaG (beta-lactamase superfamily)